MSTNHAGQLPERAAALKLQPADILLVHSKNSFWGRLIRWGTHCYWNHAQNPDSCRTKLRKGLSAGRAAGGRAIADPSVSGIVQIAVIGWMAGI